jgi:lipoprotein-releasing system permease protein
MNLPFELHVAFRYLLARRKQASISVISVISAAGVMVGVAAVIIALALMTGLQGELRDRILGSTAHVYVWKGDGLRDYQEVVRQLRGFSHVVGAAPTIITIGLVSTPEGQSFITLKGIDPTLEPSVTDIGRSMRQGSLAALTVAGDGPPGILIGAGLAKKLDVRVGDRVQLLTAEGAPSAMGMLPRSRPFTVAGIFSFGLSEFDTAYGLVSIPVAQRLTGRDDPDLIELRIDDIYRAPEVARAIMGQSAGIYLARDWTKLNQSLFKALWLEKIVTSITIGLIVLVAALNIVASLILLVMEKHSDIAILKTMGASGWSIRLIFMVQGATIGVAGVGLGGISGWAISTVADRYQLIRLPSDVYQVTYVPFVILPLDFILVIALAFLLCLVATIFPSRQASKLDPAEALRHG